MPEFRHVGVATRAQPHLWWLAVRSRIRLACAGLVALLCAIAAPAAADVGTTAITLIPSIQGSTGADPNGAGYVSPLVGQTVTIEGVVTGHDDENGVTDANPTPGFPEDRGIFVQEEVAEADSDPQSSEGIFVGSVVNPLSYPIGNRVQVTGIVAERFDHTQINVAAGGQPTDLGAAMPADIPVPVTLDEATAEAQNVLAADIPGDCEFPADVCREGRRSYYERFEGMLVNLPVGVANSGGVDRAAELFVTPGPQLDPVLVTEDPAGTSDAGVRGLIGATNDAGSGNPLFGLKDQTSTTNLPVDHQDQVLNLRGPLAFGAANYKIVPQAGALPAVVKGPTEYPFSRVPVQPADTLRATFFNVEDFFVAGGAVDGSTVTAAEYETKRDRIADAIDRLLERPDVVGVEEAGGLSNAATGLAALQDLAATLGGYTAHLLRGRDDRFGDAGFLIKDGVTATNLRQLGLDADEAIAGTNCSDAPPRLYDRPPLAIDLVKGGLDVTAIVNHFAEREAPDSCRVAQAAFLEDEVAALQTAGREVIVGGDLNAMEFESALDELTDGETTLTNLVEQLPATDRYSFQSLGRLQLLDHLLVTGGLADAVADVRIAHFDTEYYDRTLINAGAGCDGVTPPAVCSDGHKASDRDPPLVTLNLPAAPTSTYAELVDADDPRGYWRFGETSGPALTDSSGNGNHRVPQRSGAGRAGRAGRRREHGGQLRRRQGHRPRAGRELAARRHVVQPRGLDQALVDGEVPSADAQGQRLPSGRR